MSVGGYTSLSGFRFCTSRIGIHWRLATVGIHCLSREVNMCHLSATKGVVILLCLYAFHTYVHIDTYMYM